MIAASAAYHYELEEYIMQPISGISSGAAQPSVPTAGVDELKKVRRPEDETLERRQKPVMDEYVPEEKPEPSGRYWLGKDEDGKPKIYFNDPERTEDASDAPDASERNKGAEGPEKSGSDKKAKSCTCNTDKVDREIEKLKKQKRELEQQINRETDETKAENLKAKLAQVERELSQKDNDTYRRQHATYTFS